MKLGAVAVPINAASRGEHLHYFLEQSDSEALIIEARFDKRRILETYLNQVYLGQQGGQSIHGVGAASRFWFGRDVAEGYFTGTASLVGGSCAKSAAGAQSDAAATSRIAVSVFMV
jgi:membrane carboxypeptidase/penicillin-binding protein